MTHHKGVTWVGESKRDKTRAWVRVHAQSSLESSDLGAFPGLSGVFVTLRRHASAPRTDKLDERFPGLLCLAEDDPRLDEFWRLVPQQVKDVQDRLGDVHPKAFDGGRGASGGRLWLCFTRGAADCYVAQ